MRIWAEENPDYKMLHYLYLSKLNLGIIQSVSKKKKKEETIIVDLIINMKNGKLSSDVSSNELLENIEHIEL